MPDWDQDSPRLQNNLARVLDSIQKSARRRSLPAIGEARSWHTIAMQGLDVPEQGFVGKFRGEKGLENIQVRIGPHFGVEPGQVANELALFERTLQTAVQALDRLIPPDTELNVDTISAILDLCAWTHAEWVRIHPFANGNGRTARLWANSLALRYGLPPFVRLRPRPEGVHYGKAGEEAMKGNWGPTATIFRQMLNKSVNKGTSHS